MKMYLVGGIVRDYMLGVSTKSKDFDFAVEAASYTEMRDTLIEMGAKIWQERPEFVTLRCRITLPLGSFGGLIVPRKEREHAGLYNGASVCVDADFTLCRAETQYSDGRHPDTVTPTCLDDDLRRRDFTVNAAAMDIDGILYDPYGGQRDASTKTLRTVGNPAERFEEDPLRILRALRFAVKYGFILHPHLVAALNSYSVVDGLRSLPVDRVRDELTRMFSVNGWLTMMLLTDYWRIGRTIQEQYPSLWFKPTTEAR